MYTSSNSGVLAGLVVVVGRIVGRALRLGPLPDAHRDARFAVGKVAAGSGCLEHPLVQALPLWAGASAFCGGLGGQAAGKLLRRAAGDLVLDLRLHTNTPDVEPPVMAMLRAWVSVEPYT